MTFSESRFLGWTNFSFTTFAQRADFSKATFTQRADFNEATFAQEAYFSKATFTQEADFSKATFAQEADFNEATFTRNAYFYDANFAREAHFYKTTFAQEGRFSGATFAPDAVFVGATFAQETNFSGATFEGRHIFSLAKFKKKAVFNNVTFKKNGIFGKCIFEGEASFTDITTRSHLVFNDVTVHERFAVGTLYRKTMALKSLYIVDCIFEKNANVHIGNIVTDNLALIRLRNVSSLVKLVSITVQKHFVLHDSTLSGAELNNINLAKNDGKEKWEAAIKIALSSFTQTAFNNVQWGDVERIEADRDTFRQLKAANEDQKNYLQANGFYMMEMKECGKEIKNKKWWKSWTLAQERTDFWFGEFVSDFSNDWVRPILLFLIVSFGFHLVAFTCLHWNEINDFRRSFLNYLLMPVEAWGFYLLNLPINDFAHFINPLAREADADYKSVYLWWLLHKILGGLIIYQIIISLRRKTRR